MDLTPAVQQFFNKYNVPMNQCILAFSGGMDSVALFYTLLDLVEKETESFSVVHINHDTRKECAEEEIFVKSLCKKHKINCLVEKVSLSSEKGSLEIVAHKLRKKAYEKAKEYFGKSVVLTAHHKDDQIETIFMRMGFGSGQDGIQGLAEFREGYGKPFLSISRSEIECFQKEKGFTFVEDESNSDVTIQRNFWRHKIIPEIRLKYGNGFEKNVLKTVENLKGLPEDDRKVEKEIDTLAKKEFDSITFPVERLNVFPSFFQKKIIESCFVRFFKEKINFSRNQLIQLQSLLNSSESGKKVKVGLYLIHKDYDLLIFSPVETQGKTYITLNNEKQIYEKTLSLQAIERQEFSSEKSVEFVDGDKIEKKMEITYIEDSESFTPLNGVGTVRVNRFLKNEKIPNSLRKKVPILFSDGRIVWILGMRLSEEFKVTKDTTNIIKLEYK